MTLVDGGRRLASALMLRAQAVGGGLPPVNGKLLFLLSVAAVAVLLNVLQPTSSTSAQPVDDDEEARAAHCDTPMDPCGYPHPPHDTPTPDPTDTPTPEPTETPTPEPTPCNPSIPGCEPPPNTPTPEPTETPTPEPTETPTPEPTPTATPSVSVRFSSSAYTVGEGSSRSVTLRLSSARDGSVQIPVTVSRGTAESGDYSVSGLSGGKLTISAGATSGSFTIRAKQDGDTNNETVNLSLGSLPSGVTAGSPSTATLTIRDDDTPPTSTPTPTPTQTRTPTPGPWTPTPTPTQTPEPTPKPSPCEIHSLGSISRSTSARTKTGTWASGCESLRRVGRYARQYRFDLQERADVQIDLVSSTDPYLYLLAGERGDTVAENDDVGSGNRNSRIVAENLSAGTYTIDATTYAAGKSGSFELTLKASDPDPVITGLALASSDESPAVGESVTLAAVAVTDPVGAAADYRIQERAQDGSWDTLLSLAVVTGAARHKVSKAAEGSYEYRTGARIPGGSGWTYSDPITVSWGKDIIRLTQKSTFGWCSGLYVHQWAVASSSSAPGGHRAEILAGKFRTGMYITEGRVCVKARFVTIVDGPSSVYAEGSLYVHEKRLPNDSATVAKLKSDTLTSNSLLNLYEVPDAAVAMKDSKILDCVQCRGGYTETSAISLDLKYLKRPVVKANGTHRLDDGTGTTVPPQWETPLGGPPSACGLSIPTWTSMVDVAVYFFKEFAVDPLATCPMTMRIMMKSELLKDIPGLDNAAINNVIGKYVPLPKEGE